MSARLCVLNTLGGLKLSTIKTIGLTGRSTQLLEPHCLAFFVVYRRSALPGIVGDLLIQQLSIYRLK